VLLASLLSAVACASPVRVDYDPAVALGSLHAWAWNEPPESDHANPFADNPLLRKRVREAVSRRLAAAGYVQVDDGDAADFAVTFHVTLETRTVSEGYGYGGWPYANWGGGYQNYSFQEGTLILDIMSPDASNLFWRGWVSGAVPTADTDRGRVDAAVEAILDRFVAAD
jgi:hypothetical protein